MGISTIFISPLATSEHVLLHTTSVRLAHSATINALTIILRTSRVPCACDAITPARLAIILQIARHAIKQIIIEQWTRPIHSANAWTNTTKLLQKICSAFHAIPFAKLAKMGTPAPPALKTSPSATVCVTA